MGILNKKERIFDTIVTSEGRRQIATCEKFKLLKAIGSVPSRIRKNSYEFNQVDYKNAKERKVESEKQINEQANSVEV